MKQLASLEGTHPGSTSPRCFVMLTYPLAPRWRQTSGSRQGTVSGDVNVPWSPVGSENILTLVQRDFGESGRRRWKLCWGAPAAICFRRGCGISCPGDSIGTHVQGKHRLLFPKANSLISGKPCFAQLFEPNRKSVVFYFGIKMSILAVFSGCSMH